jgi:mono/diheme cytochrome c family protein
VTGRPALPHGRAPWRSPRPGGVLQRPAFLCALLVSLLAACEKEDYDPPDRAARVADAEELYRPAFFDTIQWESRDVQLRDGAVVYVSHCRRCHGIDGEGGTEYAAERGLNVPSLVRADWPDAQNGDVDAVRRRIFAGHTAGMPTWGVAGITPREIDAVAAYILLQLRPEFGG